MNGPMQRPNNMSELCRLCLAEDEVTSPIFGEEDSSSGPQIPLSLRIMACVSVEVSSSDGLPTVICDKCLYHVNTWHEFKQTCDVSQAMLKEWQNNPKDNATFGDKDIVIKQEPVDLDPEEDDMEIFEEEVSNQVAVEDIKQEVDTYGEESQDSLSVEAVDEEKSNETLGIAVACTSNPETKDLDDVEVEIVPLTAGDVSHLRITDIKTERGDIIPIGDVAAEPTEGRLLRSVLQGKTKLTMYSKKVPASADDKMNFHSVKPFHCRLCDKSFAYNYLLKRHEKTHKGDRNVCGFCQKGFSSHASLVQHVQVLIGTTAMPYSCDLCQQEFACRTQYLSHTDGTDGSDCSIVLASKDISQEIGELQEQSSQCEVCNENFPSMMLLRLHMRKEHLHYSCHKCDKSYTNGVALSNHVRSHSIGGTRHHCESCTRTFPNVELLKKHERTHMRENAAMTIIPAEIVTKSSEYSPEVDTNLSLPEIELYLDRPIKMEPPDSPEMMQEMEQQIPEENANSQQTHVCHLCSEHFPTIASLRFHLKGVHLHYQCHRCPKVYSSGVALSNHLRSHSLKSVKKHKCLACMKTFSTIDLLNRHKKSHTAPPILQTHPRRHLYLENEFETLGNDLNISAFEDIDIEPVDIDEPLAKRTCTVCNLVSASPSALERHMACHTSVKHYTCTICHVSMSYASSLQKHYRVTHNKHVELRTIQKNVSAEVYGSDVVTISKVQKNQEQVSEKSPSTTRSGRKIIFNKTFKMTAQLQPAQLPTPYECKVCKRSFAYRSYLLRHSKVHENSQPTVSCPICQKKFPDLKTLNNHKGVHTRFKHFGCNICGKSFNGLNAWQKHERMHKKGFIYSCKLCGKKFLSKAELHEHKKMHIKVKIYTCAVCKNSYHSSSALGKHKRRHGHWYASPENSDLSEIEIANGYGVTASKAPVLKAPVMKAPVMKAPVMKAPLVKQSIPKSLLARTVITKAPVSVPLTQYPSGKRRPYCSLCNKTFSHVSALRKHKRLHERNGLKYPAPQEQKFPVSAAGTAEYVCMICNRSFADRISLVRHKGWHTRRKFIPSPETTITSTLGKMPVNPCFVKSEPATINPYQCSLCSKSFNTSGALENHVRTHSEANIKRAPAEKSKVMAEFNKNEVLTAPRRLACKICKKPFESKKALITHIGWHSRDSHINKPSFNTYKPKGTSKIGVVDKFSCTVCHKIFSSAVILSKHRKLHERKLMSSIREKPVEVFDASGHVECFSCSVCHKSFKLKKYLHIHMRLHTGEKRFKCTLCPQAYHRSGSLWKHKRTHHGINKVFSCPVCQKRFGLKSQLRKHMVTHETPANFESSETVFACSICEKIFSTLAKFKQHEKSHHA